MIIQPVPQYGYSRPHFAALICLACLAISLAGFAIWTGVTHWAARQADERRRTAAWAEYQHQLLLSRTFHSLQVQYPTSKFAVYPKNGGSITLNTPLKQATVRYLKLLRSNDKLHVTVGLFGSQEEAQAPIVNVALYDENGNILSQSTIVKFVFANLEHGEVRDVEDEMDYPVEAQPEFVSVDGGT